MDTKPTPGGDYARRISESYQRLAKFLCLGMEPEAVHVSGIDLNDPEQVGLAKKFQQDMFDLNTRR